MSRRREHPRPEPLPEGLMYWYGEPTPISLVESFNRSEMKGFDDLPTRLRMACNAFGFSPRSVRQMATKRGVTLPELARQLIAEHRGEIIKARKA